MKIITPKNMLIVEKKDFLIIPVIKKETGEKILIKNFRFNPDIHELIEANWNFEKVKNMHKEITVIINSEDLIDKTETEAIEAKVVEEPVEEEVKTEEATADVPVEEAPKRRGRPKKS